MLDALWIFFILISLQPILKQKLLESSRQRLMVRIEKARGSRFIALIHRQETMGFLGFPVFRYINVEDSEEVIRAIHMTDPDVPLDIVLHTPGGLVLASLQVARAIRRHRGKVTVFVPHYAMSGGTLIALAADEIVMCEHAVLGPVDPQLGQYPAASLIKVAEDKPIADVDDQTLLLADQARKAVAQVHDAVRELLGDRLSEESREKIAKTLSEGRWTHDYPITPTQAQGLGLPVKTQVPDDVMSLMTMYPQPVRKQPTVEYLPIPKRSTRESN